MKSLKKMIIVLIILILIISIIISFIIITEIRKQNKEVKEEKDSENALQEMIVETTTNEIKKITDEAEYFNVKKCLDNYKAYSDYLYYAQLYDEIPDGEKENLKLKKKQLLNIVPEFVIQKLELSADNVYAKIGLPDKEMRIDNILVSTQRIEFKQNADNVNIKAYIVNGVFIDRNNYQKEEFNMIVLMDATNFTYLVVPQKYIEQEKIELKEGISLVLYTENVIKNNNYNNYTEKMQTEEDMSKEYFNRFRQCLTKDILYIYNKLEEEYRNKRFETYEKFVNYINDNIENLSKVKLTSYMVNHNEESTEYICKDQYENVYIFEQVAPLDFSLKLDNYTILTEKFKKTYEDADNYKKIQMNIDKFFQMINRYDYETAYKYLAEGYRNNYFKTEGEFSDFAKNNFYTYNKISFESSEQRGEKLYTYEIALSDLTGTSQEVKKVFIVMQLNDDFNFEMSFSI